MSESNNGIIRRALRRILTRVAGIVGFVGVVVVLVQIIREHISGGYFLAAILGAVLLFLVGFIISMYSEGKKSLEKHDKKVSELEKQIVDVGRETAHSRGNININLSLVDVENAITELVKDIRTGTFHPDIIIGIDRGGATVGGMLAKHLQIPLTTISAQERWTISDSVSSLDDSIKDPGLRQARGINNILLVDDRCGSGRTMEHALIALESILGPNWGGTLKTATILNVRMKLGPSKVIIPDLSIYETDNVNLRMPWDRIKDQA